MADPNTRQGKRTPVTLKIKFKSETLEQFIERYAVDVSQGGIFIRTKEPLAVGTQMKFEFQLKDASPLIAGEGTVVWTRENDPSRPAIAPGMGVRFDRLAEGSQQILEKILAEKVKQAPSRSSGEGTTKPPMFTDTPTRVAPAPVQEALMGKSPSGRSRSDSEQTPLPNPMPFHSDAEDFDEKAFEEATKVRSLDELVAETARTDDAETAQLNLPAAVAAADELAARRHPRPDTPLAEPPPPLGGIPDRDSAPGLPSPPAVEAARPGKLLDTTPSPRSAPTTLPKDRPTDRPTDRNDEPAGKTRLGLEPAKAQVRPMEPERGAVPLEIRPSGDISRPIAPSRPSSAPIVIAILVVVAAALAGVWYFVLRDNVGGDEGKGSAVASKGSGSANAVVPDTHTPVGSGSDSAGTVAGSGSGSGSGSAMAMTAGNGSGSVKLAPTMDTVIASNAPNATVEIEGTPMTGAAPFTAKLEKDKAYKAKITASGFAPKEIEVKGGIDKITAKLDPKPHVVTVTSDPAGAQILVDGVATGKVTPADVELTGAAAAKAKIHVQLRKGGFRPIDQTVESWTEEDGKMTTKVDAKLVVAPIVNTPPNNGGGPKTGSGSAAGSADASAGSAATPPPPPPPPATGSAAEPEPDFNKLK